MALLWFFLGGLLVACIGTLGSWIKGNGVSLGIVSGIGIIFGGLLLFFTMAWCVTSFIEGESQAGIMGLLFFGVPAVIVLVLTGRNLIEQRN